MGLDFGIVQRSVRDAHAFGPGLVMRHLAKARGAPRHSWHLPGYGKVTIRLNTTDLAVMRQVFQSREYDMSKFRQYTRLRARYEAILASGEVPVVIDAGANIGASALWFAHEFPRARILSVEPDPDNAACCRANVAAHPQITLHEAAIGSAPGRIVLENPSGDAWAVRTRRSEAVEGIEVVTVAELVTSVDNAALFLVKIDIEGFESDLFARNIGWIDSAAAILIETHDWMFPGRGTSLPLQKAMADRRFEMVLNGENLIYFNLAEPGSR